MKNNSGLTIDASPLFNELLRTKSLIMTLISTLLTPEQKNDFDQKYPKIAKDIIIEFLESNPDIVPDADKFLKDLEK